MVGLTVCLPVYDAVYDICTSIAASVPGVLIARESTPVEGRVRVRDIRHQCLRDGEVGLGPLSAQPAHIRRRYVSPLCSQNRCYTL